MVSLWIGCLWVDPCTQVSLWVDADGDGLGDPARSDQQCDGQQLPTGYARNGDDCDDGDAALPADWFVDGDGDGLGAEGSPPTSGCALGSGYATVATDCDDGDANLPTDWYPDGDGDGLGDPLGTPNHTCAPGTGWSTDATDCDDGDDGLPAEWFPDADGDGLGAASAAPTVTCDPGTNFTLDASDCDDGNPYLPTDFYDDTDGDGFGDPAIATPLCAASAGWVADASDCAPTDDSLPTLWYADADGDGFGDADVEVLSCDGAGLVDDTTDCDDGWPLSFPDAPTVLDGEDNACDGPDDSDDRVGTDAASASWFTSTGLDADGSDDEQVSALAVGDFDGDGLLDIAVGVGSGRTPEADDGGYVSFLSAGDDAEPLLTAQDRLLPGGGAFSITYPGDTQSGDALGLGRSVSAWDADADGNDEVLIGAPDGLLAAWLFESPLDIPPDFPALTPGMLPAPPDQPAGFGSRVELGRISGTRLLMVAAPEATTPAGVDGGGLVFGFEDVMPGTELFLIEGSEPDSGIHAMAWTDGDLSAVAVAGRADSAAVYILVDPLTTPPVPLPSVLSGVSIAFPEDPEPYLVFPCDITSCLPQDLSFADADDDGDTDLLVGTPSTTLPGAAFVLDPLESDQSVSTRLGNSQWLKISSGTATFGATFDVAGDVDGDGAVDLWVTDPDADVDGVDGAGAAWLFFGGPDLVGGNLEPDDDSVARVAGTQPDEHATAVLLGGFDVSNDGAPDVLLGGARIGAPSDVRLIETLWP